MDITIFPKKLSGTVTAIPSKSQAHRLLICAAFSDLPTSIFCHSTSQDIEATADCLRALGAKIHRTKDTYEVVPIFQAPKTAVLNCQESGSTLRFMLPIVGALGVDADFKMSGRLPKRPLSPLWEEMERMGCILTRPTEDTIHLTGKLNPGTYTIDGSVSSQFITGFLFALALLDGNSKLNITGNIESKPYIDITKQALSTFGVSTNQYAVQGSRPFTSPGKVCVEGDWSNGAFFLAAKALGSPIQVFGLDYESIQGDKACATHFPQLAENMLIDATDIPDLVPILAVVAGANKGATFKNIARLRLKESDRVSSVATMLNNLGSRTEISENVLTIYPCTYKSCTINACGDHRIAMSAAIAATAATGPVTILGAECVAKSYPTFWDEYKKLGGNYEQHIR